MGLAATAKFPSKLTVFIAKLVILLKPIHKHLSPKRKDKARFLKIKESLALLREEMMLKIVKNRCHKIRMILKKIFRLIIMKK